ncbi:MAG: hypothetical protein ABJ327_12565 [Litoreibacter sp.]
MPFIVVSLMVNIVVAGLLPIALLGRGALMQGAFGPDTPSRRILACMYGTIALVSLGALVSVPTLGSTEIMIHTALVLLPFQIIFTFMTVALIGQRNAVATGNIIIAALHGGALAFYLLG